jgi:hypothetical protein
MDKWEYAWARVDSTSGVVVTVQGAMPRVESNDLLNYLERAGEAGWELVAVTRVGSDEAMFFKRHKQPQEAHSSQRPF